MEERNGLEKSIRVLYLITTCQSIAIIWLATPSLGVGLAKLLSKYLPF